jgi:hypothetical protein
VPTISDQRKDPGAKLARGLFVLTTATKVLAMDVPKCPDEDIRSVNVRRRLLLS